MKVTIFAMGTHGDVRPLVALGVHLRQIGHEVLMVAQQCSAALMAQAGLPMMTASGDVRVITEAQARAVVEGTMPAPLTLRRLLYAMAENWGSVGVAAAEGADLLVSGGDAAVFTPSIADVTGVPLVIVHLHPGGTIKHVPALANRTLNTLLSAVGPLVWWWTFAGLVNGILRPQLGLARHPWYGPEHQSRRNRVPTLFALSPALLPPLPRLPDFVKLTGFWTLDTSRTWRPPGGLVDFLDGGPAPVYIGFGSMPDPDPARTAEMIVEAVGKTTHRAVVAAGWAGIELSAELGGDRLFAIAEAPHDWLFPRMRAAVHHCGAGTTAAAVRAGIPTVPVTFWADQFIWANALHQAGAAPKAVKRRKLTADWLGKAIEATDAPAVRDAAAALGATVRMEAGEVAAVDALTQWGLLA
jgi:UDP:flavonoid glycosyltransferase YjiC (YdhE family)